MTDSRPWHAFYDEGVPVSLSFEEITLPEMLERAAQRYPDRTALIFLNRRMSYRQLHGEVQSCAAALAELGLGRGDRLAIQLPNLPQTVIAVEAALSLGAVVVMTNPLYTPREIEHQWHDAGCKIAVVADFLYATKLHGLRDRLPVRHYLVTGVADYLRFPLNLLAPWKLRRMDPPRAARLSAADGVQPWRELLRRKRPPPPRPRLAFDDLALLQYTGGTTGASKGAMLTHRSMSCNLQQVCASFVLLEPGREVMLSALPHFHIFGLMGTVLWPIAVGGTIVLQADPRDVGATVRNIARHRVTLFPAVPATFHGINEHPDAAKTDLRSVKGCISGSAPLPIEVLEKFERLTGGTIVEGFGMTETSLCTHCNPLRGLRKIGSVGLPGPSTDARIVDPLDGASELPAGQEGELILRGPQIMRGYWNRPEETAQALRDGWLYTGDLARMDQDGYFYIVGRKKDMINAGGYKIYPDEIDQVLTTHPAVAEACTIGVPDPKRGETVKSFVVLRPGSSTSDAELIAHCRQQLAAYKVPRAVEFRAALPRSSVLKLLRRVLREEEAARAAVEADLRVGPP